MGLKRPVMPGTPAKDRSTTEAKLLSELTVTLVEPEDP